MAGGFAFAAADVVAYYETQGYRCTTQEPSSKAAGFSVRTCDLVDEVGRTRTIGVVTDPQGGLANAFASVQDTETEAILEPVGALDPLVGFLGAMLGETEGDAVLPWLAAHLGDDYAQTMAGDITLATYTPAEGDHSTLFLELANPAYLAAPAPQTP